VRTDASMNGCALEVKEAQSGDLLLAGRALICHGHRHRMARRMPRGDMVGSAIPSLKWSPVSRCAFIPFRSNADRGGRRSLMTAW